MFRPASSCKAALSIALATVDLPVPLIAYLTLRRPSTIDIVPATTLLQFLMRISIMTMPHFLFECPIFPLAKKEYLVNKMLLEK